jgi:hypothetical protein
MLKRCCDFGKTRAKQLPVAGCSFSNSSFGGLTTNSVYKKQCERVVENCCIKEHRSRNCEEGKILAKSDNQCNTLNNAKVTKVANESTQACCLSCKLGLMASKINFECAFNASGMFGLSSLYQHIYYECCSEAKITAHSSQPAIRNGRTGKNSNCF